ncbi:YfhO family protein [Anaeromyxobacter paludicola]|uniref:YfhO family protein n=1 Tax=Anaeromyxobacter paludicola TaxID=2918171 RepID=A0ABM7X6I0_9BACT|nr:YfhO family protein [Anaeromyxobacter paludicola]BDG07423.1 hypothetical protein AMPC_05360 [Anaeromyxobacter paludicola]
MRESRGRFGLVLAGLAGLAAVAYARVLFLGETFVQRDALTYLLPSRAELAAALRAGRLPEWTDGVGLGAPFAANPIHGVTYPPAWLSAVLPVSFGADLGIVLHLLFGAAGVAVLARRLGAGARGALFGGAAFLTCGYVASMPANNNAQLLAWTPWVGAGAAALAAACDGGGRRERVRAGLLLAAALAGQLAVGEPAHVVTSGLLALGVLLALSRRRGRGRAVVHLALSGAAALPLAAASLLPLLALVAWSDRAGGLKGIMVGGWSLPPARLLELVWPGALGDASLPRNLARVVADASGGGGGGVPGPTWAATVHLGIPVLLLGAAGAWRPGRRALAALALAFVLLALGRYAPVHGLLRAVFPPERLARYPEKHLLGALVLWTALAGAGFDEVFRPGARRLLRPALAGLALSAAWLVGLALGGDALAAALAPAAAALVPPLDVAGAIRFALLAGSVSTLLLAVFVGALALREDARLGPLAPALAAAAAIGGLVWNGRAFAPTAPRALAWEPPAALAPALAAVAPGRPRPRVYLGYSRLDPADFGSGERLARAFVQRAYTNLPALHGLACLPGADSAFSGPYASFIDGHRSISMRRFAALFGVPWVLLDRDMAATTPWPAVGESEVGTVLLDAGPVRPRAFVAPRWRTAPLEEALAELAAPGRDADPGRVVRVGGGGEAAPAAGAERAPLTPCEVTVRRPEEVELACDAPYGGQAVLLEETAPGWSAAVDGAPAAIARADGLFRSVAVGPGPHRVTFRYRTPWLRAGIAVALAAWAAWGLALWRTRARR